MFSPNCAVPCSLGSGSAVISFKLRTRERARGLDPARLDPRRDARLRPGVPARPKRLSFDWSGVAGAGTLFPDGTYKPYVKLERSHRTIAIPSPIVLDTKPPVITVKHPRLPGDLAGRRRPRRRRPRSVPGERAGARDPARRLAAGRPDLPPAAARGRSSGRASSARRRVRRRPAGTCCTSRRLDVAGNASKPYPFAIVQVRYVVLARPRVTVSPGARFAIRVSTDAPKVRWRLNGRTGVAPRARCTSARRGRRARIGSTCSPAATRRGRWWSSDEPGRRTRRRCRRRRRAGAPAPRRVRRELRIAGLVAWALGCASLAIVPGAARPPPRARGGCGRRSHRSRRAAPGSSLRVPWLLALATLACVPARIPVHVGSTQANLLLPLYAVVAVAALWLSRGSSTARSRSPASSARWPGRSPPSSAGTGSGLLWSQDVRQGAIELLFFVLPFALLAVVLARLPWSRTWVIALFVAARRGGARLRGDRDRPVRVAARSSGTRR